MKLLLTMMLALMVSAAFSDDQIVKQIQKNHPNLKDEYVNELATAIAKKSVKHQICPKVLTAILMQESAYNVGAINKSSNDYGIGQINKRTIKAFNFEKDKLLTDLNYSINAAAKVLADFKRMYGKREKTYWTRYNSSNPEKRQRYSELVSRYM